LINLSYYNKGVTLHHLNRYQEALVAYEQALRLNPDYAQAYRGKYCDNLEGKKKPNKLTQKLKNLACNKAAGML
jgi:tetratricopeptide (TPR) repeat protein